MPGSIVEVSDGSGGEVYDIQGFLDTGTSGVLLSLETQQGLNLALENGVTFNDVAVGGNDTYNVSVPYYLSVAPFSIDNDVAIGNPPPDTSQYTLATGPIHLQTNQQPADEFVGPLDIFGMPVMQGKVAVMDLRPPNNPDPTQLGETQTYLYAPGTPYNASTNTTNPGIPPGDLHVKLSAADFSQFTQLEPAGTPASDTPQQVANPMIGPDPVKLLNTGSTDTTQAIRIAYGGHASTGSFLFDTGAQASFISTAEALKLHIEYSVDANGNPDLVSTDAGHAPIPNQFDIPITGAGGATVDAVGFFLDRMSLPTIEGDPINFDGAPVLVTDVTVQDPDTGKTITLDGDFGMNFTEPSMTADGGQSVAGAFDWETFDQPDGLLGLTLTAGTPLPVIVPTGTTLTAASDAAIGGAGDALALNGGSLSVTGTFVTTRNFSVSTSGGTVATSAGNTLTLSPQTLTWSAGTMTTAGSGTVVFDVTSNDVMAWTGSALNIAAGSNVVAGGTTDPFTDSLLTSNHVTILNNGSLTVNVNSTVGGITGNGHLTIGNGTTNKLQIASGSGLNTVSSLTINGNSALDLTNNHLIINYAGGADPVATIRQYLISGFNNGAWNGPGIDSSTAAANSSSYALGYADSKDPGNPAGLASGTLEVKYTLIGDADLNGTVNGIDFGILAANFNKAVTGWDKGDFDYNNIVNGIDFTHLAANFNKAASGAADPQWQALVAFAEQNGLMADVPEPMAAGLAAMGAAGLLMRRRRHSTI
jgi:MYXO-CTERM domain-containing protein